MIYIPEFVLGNPTDGPWRIRHPLDKLRDKYLRTRGNFRTFDFDLYGAQRADGAWENRVEGADWYATLLMRSNVYAREVDAAMGERIARIEAALTAIPTEINLVQPTLDEPGLGADLAELFNAVGGPRVGIAKVTKLLCLKRPKLIPMIDSVVCLALRCSITAGTQPDFGSSLVKIIRRFQAVLVWSGEVDGHLHDNHAVVNELASTISGEIDAEMTARGWGGRRPVVTPVRVLESLIWFDWGGWRSWPTMWQEGPDGIEPA